MVESFLKKIWVVLFVFTILGLIALIPMDDYQEKYMDEFHRIKARPQKHVDDTYKYFEYIENGGEPNLKMEVPKENKEENKPEDPRFRKPFYIRDKNNPNILYPYRG